MFEVGRFQALAAMIGGGVLAVVNVLLFGLAGAFCIWGLFGACIFFIDVFRCKREKATSSQ